MMPPREFFLWIVTMPLEPDVDIRISIGGWAVEFGWLGPGRERIFVCVVGRASTSFSVGTFMDECPKWLKKELTHDPN